METVIPAYRIFPIGDTAFTVDFGNVIDEEINSLVIQLFHKFRASPLPGMKEVVPAYSSITIYYDLFQLSKCVPQGTTVFDWMSGKLRKELEHPVHTVNAPSKLVTVPACYEPEFAPDLEHLAKERGLSVEEAIQIHCSKQYRVYMLGFLPGFSYMGEIDERIAMPRKAQPQNVAAGSVGIAGRQTGIYPSASPGGWHIIGRTPLRLFDPCKDKEESFCLLRSGDRVQFISISKNELENY